MELIEIIQKQIEALYGIRIGESATDYLIGTEELQALIPPKQADILAKELFLVNPNPTDDTVEVALFLDPVLQQNLQTHNPMESLSTANISDFCTLIEGVSHFVYYLHKASLEFEITELELELQAEIDKFLLLAFLTKADQQESQYILDLLFEGYDLHQNLSLEQMERYHTASELARKYCFYISKQLRVSNIMDAVKELRLFYPLSQEQKIRHILN